MRRHRVTFVGSESCEFYNTSCIANPVSSEGKLQGPWRVDSYEQSHLTVQWIGLWENKM